MPYSVEGKLVVAISSRALFDFEEENLVFDRDGEGAYIDLQFARLDVPAREGVAFPLVKKLLAFNTPKAQRVEVVILSKNDPVSGLRVFKSAGGAGLALERGVFTRGRSPYKYLDALKANLFLSANEADVMSALEAKCPAARVYPGAERPAGAVCPGGGGAAAPPCRRGAHRVRRRRGALFRRGRAGLSARRPGGLHAPRGRQRAAAATARPVQAAAGSAASAAARGPDRKRLPHEGPDGARHGAQRARARARRAHADGVEHRGRRGDVPRRPRQGRVPQGLRARLLLRRPARPHRLRAGSRRRRARAVRRRQHPLGSARRSRPREGGGPVSLTVARPPPR